MPCQSWTLGDPLTQQPRRPRQHEHGVQFWSGAAIGAISELCFRVSLVGGRGTEH